ncbi:MAG TPA: hypothetical protein VHC47_06585, partial [Mucilaginibacter sp.]|nr:hypothetical protein [Mucilaginibacter sp.]
ERSLEYQLTHIELMAEDVIPENASELAVKQIELEYRMANIMGEYREVKKRIFSLIGKALDENKLSYNYPNYN